MVWGLVWGLVCWLSVRCREEVRVRLRLEVGMVEGRCGWRLNGWLLVESCCGRGGGGGDVRRRSRS